ncbi:pseudouridine synthase [Clostridium sp. C105KSO13]|uniref:pseudouridine synthase n=1 Tax=Clostridium sp. C105KSO13 TaxID=1776045 RepID=UPI0007406437|nr:pseudouridine synthase [Clostridium sp. C105KSO13]CUX44134.1 Ribosomal small subunit pseudouridine synthase A [Clostridium sp. C105KSO13]
MKLRLDKYLADMGVGTRSEVKRVIARGLISIDGCVVKKPETKIDTEQDKVLYQEQRISYVEYEYYMLNKPAGVVSATEDKRECTVIDLIDSRRKDLFPVGRLDKDTEGLLLITNDGQLSHRLLSPKKHVDKVYYARIKGIATKEDVKVFYEGLDIGEAHRTLPAKLCILRSGGESEVEVTVQEGKFHQVKRMFHAVGKEVLYLKRIQMGSLKLDDSLLPGAYRKLTKKEIQLLC